MTGGHYISVFRYVPGRISESQLLLVLSVGRGDDELLRSDLDGALAGEGTLEGVVGQLHEVVVFRTFRDQLCLALYLIGFRTLAGCGDGDLAVLLDVLDGGLQQHGGDEELAFVVDAFEAHGHYIGLVTAGGDEPGVVVKYFLYSMGSVDTGSAASSFGVIRMA